MAKVRLSSHQTFYVLYSITKQQVKVGVTNDFDRRYQTLCRANGEELIQAFVIDCRIADQLEALVHGILFDSWVQHGEWFRFDHSAMLKVYGMISGLFLREDCRASYESDPSFSYWQHEGVLSHWDIPYGNPARINCGRTRPAD